MSHEHESEKKLEIAVHALLPMLGMLFVQMCLNYYFAPQNMIFISPYLLSFLVVSIVMSVVLWKGQICPGQRGRLTFVLKFLAVFALGNLAYSYGFTPKHIPLLLVAVMAVLLPILYWQDADEDNLYQTMIYCSFGIAVVAILQYLAVYWWEIPSLLNGLRANNFAQLQLGLLLSGWYLMLANSRLEGFFKLLIQLAILALVMNYIWTVFVLYQQVQIMPETSFVSFILYFVVQFAILAILAWLLLGKKEKQIKNPVGWSAATFLAMLYPLVSIG